MRAICVSASRKGAKNRAARAGAALPNRNGFGSGGGASPRGPGPRVNVVRIAASGAVLASARIASTIRSRAIAKPSTSAAAARRATWAASKATCP